MSWEYRGGYKSVEDLFRPPQISAAASPERRVIEAGVVNRVEKSGHLHVTTKSGASGYAVPITPAKTIGTGWEEGDGVMVVKDYDGTLYAFGFVPANKVSDNTLDHDMQRRVAPNGVGISWSLDPTIDGISVQPGGVVTTASGPHAQHISTPAKGKTTYLYQNFELSTNAGNFQFETDDTAGTTTIRLEGRAIKNKALVHGIEMGDDGLIIRYSSTGAFTTPSGDEPQVETQLKIGMDGSVTVESKSTVKISSMSQLIMSAQDVAQLDGIKVKLGAGGNAVARQWDRIAAGDHVGIVFGPCSRKVSCE